MPKPHRTAGSGQLRAHSRNSSAAKLGPNLQLTQKEPQARKGYAHYSHDTNHTTKPTIQRTNSAIRAPPNKDQAALPHQPPPRQNASEQASQHKLHAPDHTQQRNGGTSKSKPGFTLANSADDEDDEDDDEDAWISTESGAVTPSGHESESEESDAATQARTPVHKPVAQRQKPVTDKHDKVKPPPLALRTEDSLYANGHPQMTTKVTNGFFVPVKIASEESRTAALDVTKTATPALPSRDSSQAVYAPAQEPDSPAIPAKNDIGRARAQAPTIQTAIAPPSPSIPSASSSRPPSKRSSRPASMLSTTSKPEHHHSQPLRPHPLIRGNSYGQPNHPVSKPVPLAPLAVISEPQPPSTLNHSHSTDSTVVEHPMSTSPASMKTDTASPSSPLPQSNSSYRRSSVSSARSVATLPAPAASATFSQPWTPLTYSRSSDRQRTLSTLSTSSSSAAISSLAHLPAITRPTTPQKVAFFPRVNPYQDPEKMHPHLPPPYLQAHLTVLAKRHPLRESYDRVMMAKHGK